MYAPQKGITLFGALTVVKYLYWRGKSLWCSFPLPGYRPRYPLGIKRISDTKTEYNRCEKLGELRLAELRTGAVTGELQKKKVVEYNPLYKDLVDRYYTNHLSFMDCAHADKYHLFNSRDRFGHLYASDITRDDVELWRQEMKAIVAINTINLRFSYMRRVFSWARQESKTELRFLYDPTAGMEKLSGGEVRTFVLTQEQFEKNYDLFKNGLKWKERPNKHLSHYKHLPDPLFAKFYLGLWETMRRPDEVSQYTWEMHQKMSIPDDQDIIREVNVFLVPPALAKTKDFDVVVISDRLWREISSTLNRTGLVFFNSKGTRWRYWENQKRRITQVFGPRAGWIRDCRRGAITHSVEVERNDPKHVQMQSGHKTSAVFERYRIGNVRHVMKVANKTSYKGDIHVQNG